MSYIIDQQSIMFYRRIMASCSSTLRILVNHEQGFIRVLSLVAIYNILPLLSSHDTIKRCMWNNFVSKSETAGYISITCHYSYVYVTAMWLALPWLLFFFF